MPRARADLHPAALPPRALATVPGIREAYVFDIPMTHTFRRVTRRNGILMRGSAGWAEFSPFWDYSPRECAPWLRAALALAGTEWPAPVRESVPVNVTIPAVDAETARLLAAATSCRTAKVKVAEPGQTLADDEERVAVVRDELGADARIRVDANGGWALDEAIEAIDVLDRAAGGLEYAEQPVRSLEEMADLHQITSVPLAADELVRRAEDPYEVARAGAADILILKVQPLGGIAPCLEIAERTGMPVVVSSAVDSSIGLAAGAALAAALPELDHACGLGTATLLATDTVAQPLTPRDGRIVPRRPEPDLATIDAWGASAEVTAHWADRLARVVAGSAEPDGE